MLQSLIAPLAAALLVSSVACAQSFPLDPCPQDLDGDGMIDAVDLGILLSHWGLSGTTADIDGSGLVDAFDLAHVLRSWGPCALFHDCNNNGIEDATEIANGSVNDCDGDLVPDDCEDCNGNGLADDCDLAAGREQDCNGNGIPDSCESDCNGNGIPDECDIALEPALDCDGNGQIDSCESTYDESLDCNNNGILDSCEIASGLAADCNDNGVPDDCEPDCDGNGIPDDCDLLAGALDCNGNGILDACEPDCDGNGIPDDCDIATNPELDCDENGVLDLCDILAGLAPDNDGNGIPDWCEIAPPRPWDALACCTAADGFTTLNFAADPLPANLFAPGSAQFEGVVTLAGLPVDAAQFGGACMVMKRSADPFAPRDRAGGRPKTVQTTLVDLHVANTEPIPVSVNGGTQLWDLTIRAIGVQTPGSVTATKTDAFGGNADVTLPAHLQLRFTNSFTGGVVVIERDYVLETTGMDWVHTPDAALEVADDPTSNFTLGIGGAPGAQFFSTATFVSTVGGWVGCAINAIKYTIFMDIHNGLAGQSGGQKVEPTKKVSLGAVTVANLNDTNGDGTIDVNQDEVKAAAVNPKGIDEIDLMKLVVHKPLVDAGGTVKLEKLGGNIKLWTESTKKTEVPLPATINIADLPKTYWIEARATSPSLRDIGIKSTYKSATDEVRATGVWTTKTLVKATRAAAGADNALPGDMIQRLKDFIDSFKAQDGSRYGYGTFATDGANDTRTGGRIAFEFKTEPDKSETLGVVWDLSRRLEHRDWAIADGAQTLSDNGRRNFPVQQEQPNDDNSANDEDNVPKNQHIYVFDGPSDLVGAQEAFYITRNNFVEYGRVQLAGTAFVNRNGTREGSRASDFAPWHYVDYLVRNATNQRTLDGSGKKPSFSAPVRTGAGNGACAVKLLADAKTEGFTATYVLATREWTLTGTSGDPAVKVAKPAAPAGTQWKLTFGTKVEVTITQGATAFANGARFRFSVFTAKSALGKLGEVAEGATTILDEGN